LLLHIQGTYHIDIQLNMWFDDHLTLHLFQNVSTKHVGVFNLYYYDIGEDTVVTWHG